MNDMNQQKPRQQISNNAVGLGIIFGSAIGAGLRIYNKSECGHNSRYWCRAWHCDRRDVRILSKEQWINI